MLRGAVGGRFLSLRLLCFFRSLESERGRIEWIGEKGLVNIVLLLNEKMTCFFFFLCTRTQRHEEEEKESPTGDAISVKRRYIRVFSLDGFGGEIAREKTESGWCGFGR